MVECNLQSDFPSNLKLTPKPIEAKGLSSSFELVPSEGFLFSFNNNSTDECKESKNYLQLPPPVQTLAFKSPPVIEELSALENQIKEINSKISQNLEILKEKQAKNHELKTILQIQEIKSTLPTDSSFVESKCTCTQDCKII